MLMGIKTFYGYNASDFIPNNDLLSKNSKIQLKHSYVFQINTLLIQVSLIIRLFSRYLTEIVALLLCVIVCGFQTY